MKILKIDEDKKFIAGTFEFQAIDLEGEIIDVTDGRFDIIYESGF